MKIRDNVNFGLIDTQIHDILHNEGPLIVPLEKLTAMRDLIFNEPESLFIDFLGLIRTTTSTELQGALAS